MSERATRKVSKIPVFQGTKKTHPASKTVSADPKQVLSKQRAENLGSVDHEGTTKKAFVVDKKEHSKDLGEFLFEPDQQALESILTNKGVFLGATMRASEMTHLTDKITPLHAQLADSRMSMWGSRKEYEAKLKGYSNTFDLVRNSAGVGFNPQTPGSSMKDESGATAPKVSSDMVDQSSEFMPSYKRPKKERNSLLQSLEEHKENVRLFREKMKAGAGVGFNPQTPGSSMKDESGATAPKVSSDMVDQSSEFMPSYKRPKKERNSLLQSLEEHKENVRLFREKMKAVSQTLKTQGRPLFGGFTPRLKKLDPGNSVRAVSSCTPKSDTSQRTWRKLKENNCSTGPYWLPSTFSTSRKNNTKFYKNEPISNERSCSSVTAVRRPLLPSLLENEETVKNFSSFSSEQMQGERGAAVSKAPAGVNSITDGHLIQNAVDQSRGILLTGARFLPSAVFSSPFLSSSGLMQDFPSFSAPITPDLYEERAASLASSPECTWTCQKTLCTPTQSRKTFLTNIPQQNTICTPGKCEVLNKDLMKSSGYCNTYTHVPQGSDCSGKCSDLSKTSQASNIWSGVPSFQSSAVLSDKLSKIDLSSNQIYKNSLVDTQLCERQHALATTLQRQNTTLSLKLATTYSSLSPAPVRVLSSITPVPQPLGVLTNSHTPSVTSLFQSYKVGDMDKRSLTTTGHQVLEEYLKGQETPAKPVSASLCHPSVRSHTLSSCLKTSENKMGTKGLPVGSAVTSAKKLRWADIQSPSKDVRD